MRVTIEIKCDNAAFGSDPQFEVARILRKLSDNLEDNGMGDEELLFDINGNYVGALSVEGDCDD